MTMNKEQIEKWERHFVDMFPGVPVPKNAAMCIEVRKGNLKEYIIKFADEDYGWEPTIEGLQEIEAKLCEIQLKLGPKPKGDFINQLQDHLSRSINCVSFMKGLLKICKERKEDDND